MVASYLNLFIRIFDDINFIIDISSLSFPLSVLSFFLLSLYSGRLRKLKIVDSYRSRNLQDHHMTPTSPLPTGR